MGYLTVVMEGGRAMKFILVAPIFLVTLSFTSPPVPAQERMRVGLTSLAPTTLPVWVAKRQENYADRNKTKDGYRTKFYSPQRCHGRLREHLILSGIPQHLERLVERHEKRDGRYIRIRQKRIFEVNLKECGVCIPALDVGFPKHKGKSADADEHDDYLKKYC